MDPLYRIKRIGLLPALKFGAHIGVMLGLLQVIGMVILVTFLIITEGGPEGEEAYVYLVITAVGVGTLIGYAFACAVIGMGIAAFYNKVAEHFGYVDVRLKTINE